jgi:hypothetical protein
MFFPTLRQVCLHGLLTLLVAPFWAGCEKEAADPGGIYDAVMRQGADTILSFSQNGVTQTCAFATNCSDPPPACGPTEVLGPEDGLIYQLAPGEILEVGFRCSAIIEVGGVGSPDFTVVGTVNADGRALLEVGEQGDDYETLTPMTVSNYGPDLGEIQRTTIRFLRLTNAGSSPIALDAIVAIRPI